MARPTALSAHKVALLRSVTAADVSFADADLPPASMTHGKGFQTIWVGVEFDGGTTPTATIEFRFRDPDAADGERWVKMMLGGSVQSETISAGEFYEYRVDGRDLIPVVTAISGTPDEVRVLGFPGLTQGGERTFR